MLRIIILFLLTKGLWAQVQSTTGQINFDIQDDGLPEATLNAQGFGIGVATPSANLEVAGNAIVTERLSVGGESVSQSNLHIQGAFGFGAVTNSGNYLDKPNQSIVFADTASTNVLVQMPYAGNVIGRHYFVKKTSIENKLWIQGGGNLIDDYQTLEFGPELTCAQVSSDGVQWRILSLYGSGNVVAHDNLIAWYKLDETSGNTVTDFSGMNNTAYLQSSTMASSSNTGLFGSSYESFGSSTETFILTPSGTSVKGMSALTISFWARLDALANATLYYEPIDSSASTARFAVKSLSDGTIRVIANPGDFNFVFTNGQYSPGVWFHHLATIDLLSQKHYQYFNGELVGTSTQTFSNIKVFPSTLPTKGPAIGGVDRSDSGFVGEEIDGRVDDFRLYNLALSPEEVRAVYQNFPQH
jgi:hypothetical protein